MFGLLATMIGTKVVSGEVIAGTAGVMAGTFLGSYLTSLKAQSDQKKLIMQMSGLNKAAGEFINFNFASILEITVKELNLLDKGCELQLNLGTLLKPELDKFCLLHESPADGNIFQIHMLQESSQLMTPPDTLASSIERTIHEYFDSYLKNREVINSENRALAKATVQIMRNTTVLLIQAMKGIAQLPGYENEERLEKFRTIITSYFQNILDNEGLTENYNKTIADYFVKTQKQRTTLAQEVQKHFGDLIDQLIVEQREISVQTMSVHCTRDLYDLNNHLMELFARLFDAQAGADATQLSAYKITQNMLRADTSQATGKVPFNEYGIFKLLKPLAKVSEGLNRLAQEEDGLSFVRYQDIFDNPKTMSDIASWDPRYGFLIKTPIDQNCRDQLSREMIAIFKLLFICQALEKDFLESAIQYGFKGMSEKGEYKARRLVIHIFYREAMRRLSEFFEYAQVKELLDLMNDTKWMRSKKMPLVNPKQSFMSITEPLDDNKLIKRTSFITNSVFQNNLEQLEFLRRRMQYLHDGLDKLKSYETDEQRTPFDANNLTKEDRIYLFNIARTFEEYGLTRLLGLNPELPSQFSEIDKSENEVFTSLKFTQLQLMNVNGAVNKLCGKLRISSSYTAGKIAGGQVSSCKITFGENEAEIPEGLYQFLKQMNSPVYKWNATSSLLGLGAEQLEFVLLYPKHGSLLSFIEFYKRLRDFENKIREKCREELAPPLHQFFQALGDITAHMGELIRQIDINGERVKKLQTRNKLLTKENIQQQTQIVSLSSDIAKVKGQFSETQDLVQQLKASNKKHLEDVKKIEKANEDLFTTILADFHRNVKDIKELKSTLDDKLKDVREILSGDNSKVAQEASKELSLLKENMQGRIGSILERFKLYEESFNRASENLRNDFQSLKLSMSREQELIEALELKLNEALVELQKQKDRADFYEAKADQARVIVHNFSNLFDFLENKFSSRLSFWSSYRTVKTENILNFIELVLSNQQFLKNHLAEHSEQDIEREINTYLDKSQVINRYHGLFNNSSSRALIKHIIVLFQRGNLINVLKNDGISYHDRKITLSNTNELQFTEPQSNKEYSIACRIQPVS
ncbi:coiled-coil domain-containing protein [Legionella quinlivanii]|uniref:hypothetical protein n=1 Tax=Legionella quinlivanii TaxID=45073 RepID=UPI002244EC81|nr:hypothetical protein [Legionella quinlivanii]MCW8451963.1 hypothetical protein [Legionella quinlivanii]